MSWEDCGFKPGKIHGNARCDRTCSDCDGEHHFYIQSGPRLDDDDNEIPLPDGVDEECYFSCKHCETIAEAIDDPEVGV